MDPGRLWVLPGGVVVCFNLLYLFIPDGFAPHFNFAPAIKAAYARVWPLPAATLAPHVLSNVSLALQAGMWLAYLVAVVVIVSGETAPAKNALRSSWSAPRSPASRSS